MERIQMESNRYLSLCQYVSPSPSHAERAVLGGGSPGPCRAHAGPIEKQDIIPSWQRFVYNKLPILGPAIWYRRQKSKKDRIVPNRDLIIEQPPSPLPSWKIIVGAGPLMVGLIQRYPGSEVSS